MELPGIQVDYWPCDYQVPRWTTDLGTTKYPGGRLAFWASRHPGGLLAFGLPGTQVDYWPWD